ncbi:MAG TPA: transporter substrate-binding domain-containing protein [Streptosporangiaceae bacterium]|nr:transporter substrate-binding domain-containing protein [Streptosporangiaceae bacterium]
MPSIRLTALTLLAVFTAAACTAGPTASHANLASAPGPLWNKTTLTIAVKIDEPGIGYIENGDPAARTGLDIDVAGYIARHLGPRPKGIFFVDATSGSREALITGNNPARTKVDLVIASYSIDDARAAVVAFAGPYLIAGQSVLVRKSDASILDDTDGYHLEMSLRNLNVCSVDGSTSAARLIQAFGHAWAAAHLVLQAGYQDCVSKLVAGAVSAVSTDNAVLAGYLHLPQYSGQLHLAGHTFSTEAYGVGLARNDTADRAAIDAVLRKMIADGDWARFVRRDLGPEAGPLLTVTPAPGH